MRARILSVLCVAALVVGVLAAFAGTAQATFTTYDDFSGTSLDLGKWAVLPSASTPLVNGGVVTLDGAWCGIRSTEAFPIGTTLRFTVTSVQNNAVLFGVNSQVVTEGTTVDALILRNDTGDTGKVDGVNFVPTTGTISATGAGVYDFVIGTTNLEILNGITSLLSVARPAGYDEAQRFEMSAYNNGSAASLVVTEVSYQLAVPEPGTLMLLTSGLVGLLCYAWRRRK